MGRPAKISYEEQDGIAIMYLEGDFVGSDETEKLRATFKEIANKDITKLIVDMKDVIYLASITLGVLISGNALFAKKQGKIIIVGASDYILNIFKITKIDLILTIFANKEEALANISKK